MKKGLLETVLSFLKSVYGSSCNIIDTIPLSGGSISSAYKLILKNNTLFLKHNSLDFYENFLVEKEGLLELANAFEGPSVPKVIGCHFSDRYSFLILNYIDSAMKTTSSNHILGIELAKLHKNNRKNQNGWIRDNFIGATKQINTKMNSWIDFFRINRLEFQFRLAVKNGFFDSHIQKVFFNFLDKLDNYIIDCDDSKPSLLHGDLWNGNKIIGNDGKYWLIDPAVYYGHRETDIAMTKLFSGFSEDFYRSYNQTWELETGFNERVDIYNLYHLLNHLNLFGGSYYNSVISIINRYC